jgi:hypothetical protein
MSIFASSRWGAAIGGSVLLLSAGYVSPAAALGFTVPFGDQEIEGTLNTTLTAGASIRTQSRSDKFIGKGDLNPDVCAGTTPQEKHYSCQGVFKNQFQPAALSARSPGTFSGNIDDGDLNYNKYDLTSGVAKITQDISLKWGDYGFFGKALYFYDFVNNNFTESHPNLINSKNKASVGQKDDLGRTVYPKGAPVRSRRNNSSTLDQIGTNLQLLDAYFYGKQSVFSHEFTFKLGRQTVNWGESTLNAINSINSANPVNANNFFRVGSQVEEVFTPIGMVFLSTELFEGATIETFYQYEWKPLEAPAAGSFYSGSDVVGTNNGSTYANLSFGTAPDDPEGVAFLQDNPLSGLTPAGPKLPKIQDDKPKGTGQYGISLKYYAEWLNNGTGLGLYYENYHSRLPFASAFSSRASCARASDAVNRWDPALSGNSFGGGSGTNAVDTATFGQTCPNIPLIADIINPGSVKWQPGDPVQSGSAGMPKRNAAGQTIYDDALPIDTARLWIEYPRNVHLLGASFNTTVGSISLQGEVAYRPNAPLQVNPVDVTFAAFGPTTSACHRGNCIGTGATSSAAGQAVLTGLLNSTGPVGQALAGQLPGVVTSTQAYGPSDTNTACVPGSCDTFTLIVGHAPGSARAFPNFILPYRGRVAGENSPTDFSKPLDRNNPGYVQGYERFKTAQFDLGATQVLGASETLPRIIGADQVLLLYELGANWVPGLPSLDKLQITSDGGVYTSATAGADGSGAQDPRFACAGYTTCVAGPDGLRFNPHQAPLDSFATKFAWGYNIIALIRYESVFPGISFQPQIIIKHDVNGNAPGPGENFLAGRKVFDVLIETRYKSFLSFFVGYNWITGGGDKNLLADRDSARAFVKYQF